ncbi:MAG: heme-copper oxidase subunit III, partial [Planctomycetes bacterium]|nr:heme-copper oxidase subunit III [Planctomycetota bacterium]
MKRPEASRIEPVAGAGALGMKLLVISLAVLFASAIASFWVVRGDVEGWTGVEEGFRVPLGVWAGTAALALLSAAAERGARLFDRGAADAGVTALKLAFGLAVLFLLAQAWNWQELIAAHLPPGAKSLYAFNFYLLTGLHALHVIGGLVFHAVVLRRARRERYGAAAHEGPRNLAVYWHFLSLTWLALLATLLLGADPTLTAEGIVTGFTWVTGAAL